MEEEAKVISLLEYKVRKARNSLPFFVRYFLLPDFEIPEYKKRLLEYLENAKQGNSLEVD